MLDEHLGCQWVGMPLQHLVMKTTISSIGDMLGKNGPETTYDQVYIIFAKPRLPLGDVAD